MIESIELRNWKTHGRTRLSFQKGSNVLIGVMGAGKSSVLDAISFALFGTFPALNSKRVTVASMVKNRPRQEEEAEIKMQFLAGADRYVVTRKITGNGTVASLSKNGQHFQTQPTKVTEEIESALKLDYDTFSRVVYAEQNRLDYFLDLRQGERKKQIDHMLGLDLFATAEENSTAVINDMRKGIASEEEMLQQIDLKALKEELAGFEKEKAELEKTQAKLRAQEKSTKESLEKAQRELTELRKLQEKKERLTKEIAAAQGHVTALTEQAKKIDALKLDGAKLSVEKRELEKKAKEVSDSVTELRKQESALSRRLGELESAIKLNEKRKAERDKLLAELKGTSVADAKATLQKTTEELQKLSDLVSSKKGRTEEIKEIVKELSRHTGKCPVCERDLDEHMKGRLLKEKNQLLSDLETEIEKHGKESRAASDELKKIKELHDRLIVAEGKLSQYKEVDQALEKDAKEAEKLSKEHKALKADIEKQSKEADSAKDRLARIESDAKKAAERDALTKEIEKAEKERAQLEKDSKELVVDNKRVDAAHQSVTEQTSALTKVTNSIEGNTKFIAKVEVDISDRTKRVSQYESAAKRIEKRRAIVGNLNKFKSALIDTSAQLRTRLVSSINGHMQGLWPQLYPYGDYCGIRLNATKDDYSLEVNTGANGEGEETWLPVEGIASGGERSIACLSMRVALAMVVVPNLRWLILDEPTHNIDANGIGKLIETLSGPLPELVDQIFIITHEEELKQIPGRVYLLGRDKSVAASTEISEA